MADAGSSTVTQDARDGDVRDPTLEPLDLPEVDEAHVAAAGPPDVHDATHAALHLLRTSSQHLSQLSAMADIKANIVITAASIVATVSASGLAGNEFSLAVAVLGIGAVVSLTFAILAVLPKYRDRAPTPAHKRSLLFFGDFAQMPVQEFEDELMTVLGDRDAVFKLQIRSLHAHGCYLERHKYRYLRLAYFSLLGSAIAAGLVSLLVRL